MRNRHELRLLIVVVVSAFLSLAWAGEAVRVNVVSDDGQRTVLDFRLLDYRLDPVSIGGREFVRVTIPGEAESLEEAAPGLPHVSRSVIVPDDAAMAVSVVSASYRELALSVAPSKGNLPRTVDPATVPYRFGPRYAVDALYPAETATLADPYILRDYRGVAVRWNPFRYNPVTGTLRVYDHVVLEIRAVGTSAVNVLNRLGLPTRPVRSFEALYGAHFVNFGARQSFFYPPIDEDGEMLVIAYDAWIPNLAPLVAHKAALGIPTTVVGISTLGSNTPGAIKACIQEFYNTHNLAFVLLVGDGPQVATPLLNAYDAADPNYSKLAGGDNYPDILVGRFSAQTAAQVDTQVLRTVEYEDLPATSQNAFKQGIGIASDQGAGQGDEGQSDRQHIEQIRGGLLGDGYTTVDTTYDPGATAAQVTTSVNAGRGIINYCGHGSATSWGTTGFNTTDVGNLVNKDLLPFIVSVACNNGEFNHYEPCFAEAWLQASRDGRPTGAVATYMSSISQSWAPPMEAQDEFNLLFTNPGRPYASFGALCFAASSSMMNAYGQDGVDMFNTWILFGDPSVNVQAGASSGLVVSPADGLSSQGQVGSAFSPSSKAYVLRNLDATPLEFEVRAAEPWILVTGAAGTIPAQGSVTVTVSVADGASSLDLGTSTGTVQFTNLTAHVGDASRAVVVRAAGTLGLHRHLLDADPGWTRQGEWAYGAPAGAGGGTGFNPDPAAGHTGSNVFGANLAGNFSTKRAEGPFYLTMGPLNLTGVRGGSLRFWRWLNTGGPPSIDSTVEVSRDGATWTTLWSAAGAVADAAWTQMAYDISAVGDNQPAVYVRWGYEVVTRVTGGAGSGWNVDDVEIWGDPSTARISLAVERDRLDWTPIAGTPFYDLVRGDLAALRAGGGNFTAATEACVANDTAATSLGNTDAPAGGAGLWYLVRGTGYSGVLTYQDLAMSQIGGRDDEIDAAVAACP